MSKKETFTLERSIVIAARPSTVFRYFTDSERFASWWGKGSSIDPKPGGAVQIVYPGGATAGGNVLEIEPNSRIVFSYGYDDPQKPIARGASRVTITVASHPAGTLLSFVHEVSDEATREMHVAGWRFQLSLFANIVAREAHAEVDALVDRFFAAWNAPDRATCESGLVRAVTENVSFHDSFACLSGRTELALHVEATKLHMPDLALHRDGAARQVQGTALVDWLATAPDGSTKARGTNVLSLDPDGLISGIVGFWASSA